MSKISVIIPVYNAEPYLGKCMDSICSQTLKDIEIICVDDGSTDKSPQILQEYSEQDSRIKVLTQDNRYAGGARNNGMKHAEGRYLLFLDADDYFAEDMLEKMYMRAELCNSDIVICRYREEFAATKWMVLPEWAVIDSFFQDKDVFSGESLKYAGIFQIARGWAWDKLFRTEFVRRCGYVFPDFRSSEDGFFTYMLMARAEKMSYMDDVFVTHRINQSGSLSATKERDWQNGFKMLLMIKKELEKQNLYGTYRQSFLNEVINFLKWYLDSMRTFKAYKSCYAWIKTVIESEMEVLAHETGYYFREDLYCWYRTVCSIPLDEYLFQERNPGILAEQEKIISQQQAAINEKGWVFPFRLLESGKAVVLYGAGKIGQSYYQQLKDSKFCKEIVWVDRQYGRYQAQGMDVSSPALVDWGKYDYVVIANKNQQGEIIGSLTDKGISEWKIIPFAGS